MTNAQAGLLVLEQLSMSPTGETVETTALDDEGNIMMRTIRALTDSEIKGQVSYELPSPTTEIPGRQEVVALYFTDEHKSSDGIQSRGLYAILCALGEEGQITDRVRVLPVQCILHYLRAKSPVL